MRFLLILLGVLSMSAQPPLAAAQGVEVDVSQGVIQPLPIAGPALSGGGRCGELGAEIARVVMGDLERWGFFRPAAAGRGAPDVNATP